MHLLIYIDIALFIFIAFFIGYDLFFTLASFSGGGTGGRGANGSRSSPSSSPPIRKTKSYRNPWSAYSCKTIRRTNTG